VVEELVLVNQVRHVVLLRVCMEFETAVQFFESRTVHHRTVVAIFVDKLSQYCRALKYHSDCTDALGFSFTMTNIYLNTSNEHFALNTFKLCTLNNC